MLTYLFNALYLCMLHLVGVSAQRGFPNDGAHNEEDGAREGPERGKS